ncbi:hypothetical protein BT96DRAFT_937990 [Gymnopus androsaceus JB14]|uniref:Uncharacterized protein n=1 Tax=Gymnopus androsaceus JB14 TaxID=1447944 RepID=A0A6A4HSB6_9AGAR|nr:hypothetical protein BT96DRAFT_937990 [Gymnopus androsaceus JB14]
MVLLSVIAFRYMEENTGTGSAVLFASRESNVDNGVGAVSDLGHWSSRGGGDWRTALKSSSMNVKMGTRLIERVLKKGKKSQAWHSNSRAIPELLKLFQVLIPEAGESSELVLDQRVPQVKVSNSGHYKIQMVKFMCQIIKEEPENSTVKAKEKKNTNYSVIHTMAKYEFES